MNNSIIDKAEAKLNKAGTSLKEVEKIYPKIHEAFMPLSITGVSARTFLHWKKSGLIDSSTADEERAWVRINLIDYVWIKLVQIMREFGVPLDVIKQTKDIMYSNVLDVLVGEKEEYFKFLETDSTMTPERLAEVKSGIELIGELIDNSPEELGVHSTIIGTMLIELLLKNERVSLIVTKDHGKFEVDYFSFQTMEDFQNHISPLLERPNFQIPIRSLVQDFFDNPKTEKFVDRFELLSLKEKKVIEAMRKKDFTKITIQPNGKGESYNIDIEKDGAIMDEKAKEVKRILGLNEYSEITIKYRNDKHLHFKNKTRL